MVSAGPFFEGRSSCLLLQLPEARPGSHGVSAEAEPEQAGVCDHTARVGQGQHPECPGAGCRVRRLQVLCAPCERATCGRAEVGGPVLEAVLTVLPVIDVTLCSAARSIEELRLDFSERDISNAAKLPGMLAQVVMS